MGTCHSCGGELTKDNVFRSSLCPVCGKAVRVCLNCKFHSPVAHWECRESISELVREKDLANFCDFFSLNDNVGKPTDWKDGSSDVRTAFDRLFDE